MKIVVQKFGGSSLVNAQSRGAVVAKIIAAIEKGFTPVIVVSAIGRKGDPYATDTILKQALDAHHLITNRDKDMLLSCGEIISSVVVAQRLISEGYRAMPLSGMEAGIVTDNQFGSAQIRAVDTKKIRQLLESNIIPVIAGYQGFTEDLEITTLGRGGSDTTAAIIASALQAEHIELYSDVNGLMTADPQLVKDAQLIMNASYSEVVEMAHKGARVIHPLAVEIAKDSKISLHLKSTFNDRFGTMVTNIRSDKPVTGVTSDINIVLYSVTGDIDQADLLREIASKSISLDMIDITSGRVSFLISRDCQKNLEDYMLQNRIKFVEQEDICKISVVGSGMSGVPGVIARVCSALQSENIQIFKSMDSHTAISCIIKEQNEIAALNSLHKEFNLEIKK